MDFLKLHQIAHQTLLDLATDEGINASGKDEVFGCIFGRDSALTILKILRSHRKNPLTSLLPICRRSLLTLSNLQGKEFNIESGEQPGKFIHEFRKSKYEHLLSQNPPWFIYPDGFLRNYDSIDSTPLGLIAIYRYWEVTSDDEFLVTALPAVEEALNWIITFGDLDKDLLIEYELPEERSYGGLTVQSWTDSSETLCNTDGRLAKYPIAPVEVQAFCWLALKLWADFYANYYPKFAHKLDSQANKIKDKFNKKFIFKDDSLFFAAQALDGDKNQIRTITANPLLCLWACYQNKGKVESILEPIVIDDLVERVFQPDMFVEGAGIRTMSSLSPTFNPNTDCYHNGSFWPILNGLIVEGLENFGFDSQARELKHSALLPITYFGTPIELYIKNNDEYLSYQSPTGQFSCKQQAWSAAAILDMTADFHTYQTEEPTPPSPTSSSF